MRNFKVSSTQAGQRADIFIASKYPNFTRSALIRLFDQGLVKHKSTSLKPGHKLAANDRLSVDDRVLYIHAETIELPIIYEDDDVIVINKPSGILSHAKGALNDESTVASFIRPKLADLDPANNRAGIVHRLDRATSGIMITAKNQASLKHLQKQFSNRRTKKTYMAVVEGWPDPEGAIIDAPIARNQKKPKTFKVSPGGKPAQTAYRTLKQFQLNNKRYALLELKPITGRTHQLRVHFKYLNHPIVGDQLYGHPASNLLLHAKELELTLPGGQRQIFQADPPDYFKKAIKHD